MKKFYKKFTSKKSMVDGLSSLTDQFDTEAMVESLAKAGPRRLYLVTSDGKRIACDNFKKFISILATKGDLDILYPICFGRAETYHIYSKTDYFNTQPEEVVEKETSVDEELIKEEVVEQPELSKVEESVSEEVVKPVEEEESTPKVDWEHLESLYNEDDVRGSKDKLEAFVQETWGIDLRKNQKFDGMLEELRKALEE